MNRSQPSNLAASVQQRLRSQAAERREILQGLLDRYARERFLYRLSESEHCDTFILKGATVFIVWSDEPHRATKDIDLLGHGVSSVEHLEQIFREICGTPVDDDGFEFKAHTVRGERIKEDQVYEGVRIHLRGFLSGTRTRSDVQIDVGFGDVVTPEPQLLKFPTLLDFPAPHLKTYPPETVVAEKFQAMVMLGMSNSRLKDFYDLWYLCQEFEFEGEKLCQAFKATFEQRKTPLPLEIPLALTKEFSEDFNKQKQWEGFWRKWNPKAEKAPLNKITAVLEGFLMPPALATAQGKLFHQSWRPSSSWQ